MNNDFDHHKKAKGEFAEYVHSTRIPVLIIEMVFSEKRLSTDWALLPRPPYRFLNAAIRKDVNLKCTGHS